MFEVTREMLYSHAGARRRYAYKVTLAGDVVASHADKATAVAEAWRAVSDAWRCASNPPLASVASDGAIITTREYAPGQVETVFHRGGQCGSSCVGGCSIDGKHVSPREYHEYFVQKYEEAVSFVV